MHSLKFEKMNTLRDRYCSSLAFLLVILIGYTSSAQTHSIILDQGNLKSAYLGPILRDDASSDIDHSRLGCIYTRSELSIPTGAVIEKVEWYKESTDTFITSTYSYFDIWITNTDSTLASSTTWSAITDSSSLVLHDSFNVIRNIGAGWIAFEIAPFVYGGNSLQIVTDFDCSLSESNPTSGSFLWKYDYATTKRTFYNSSLSSTGPSDILNKTRYARPTIRITYSYVPAIYDAGIAEILTPKEYSCEADSIVSISLRNFGSDTLKSVTLRWSVNGSLQDSLIWVGSLNQGASETLILDTLPILAGVPQNLVIWTEYPNDSTDLVSDNDTVSLQVRLAMSGEYTVGNNISADYMSLTTALNDLNAKGVCGNVRLLVYEGTYNGQYAIGAIPGIGPNAQVEIVSHPDNASLPKLKFSPPFAGDGYVFEFTRAAYVSLDSLEIELNSTYRETAISIRDRSDFITITNSVLRCNFRPVAPILAVVIASGLMENLVIENNRIVGGGTGISLQVYQEGRARGVKILKNEIDSFNFQGIKVGGLQDAKIIGNFIKSSNDGEILHGISCSASSGTVSNNNIILSNDGYLTGFVGWGSEDTLVVKNNTISLHERGFKNYAIGVSLYSQNQYNLFVNNSIAVYGGHSLSRCIEFQLYSNSQLISKNNLAANFGKGYALYVSGDKEILTSDYNAYYAAKGDLVYWSGKRKSLFDFQSISDQDSHSLMTAPRFFTDTDLHTLSADLNNAGIRLSDVILDMDNEARSTDKPDIGADEFTPLPVDAGISRMVDNIYCEGHIDTKVELYNDGLDTLKNVRLIRQVAQANGAFISLDTINWSGSLTSGKSDVVSLGSYFLGRDTAVFRFITEQPNMASDSNTTNDTLVSYVEASMSGVYSVGYVNSDFRTVFDALEELKRRGLCGPVRFEIKEGIYTDQLLIENINNLDSLNTLEFTSDPSNSTLPILRYNLPPYAFTNQYSNCTVRFTNMSNVTLDSLEIRAGGDLVASAIIARDGSEYITISNCKVVGMQDFSQSASYQPVINILGEKTNKHFSIVGNDISLGSGIGVYGKSLSRGESLRIVNNHISNFEEHGISLSYQTDALVEHNRIENPLSSVYFNGLLSSFDSSICITRNTIHLNTNVNSKGMLLSNCTGTAAKPALIKNNMISLDAVSERAFVVGVEIQESQNTLFAHNSVALSTGGSHSKVLSVNLLEEDSVEIYNNSLAHFGKGFAIYFEEENESISCDYNNLFTNGPRLALWNGRRYSSLKYLQDVTGGNLHSINFDPGYYSISDLHTRSIALSNSGLSLPQVTEDIDLDIRSNTPDIGADEYSPRSNDLAMLEILEIENRCSLDSQMLWLVVANYGVTTQSSYSISIDITGDLTQTLNETVVDSILTGQRDTITLGYFNASSGSAYSLRAFTSLASDEDLSNDTTASLDITYSASFSDPIVTNSSVCEDDSLAEVSVSGGQKYRWYHTANSTEVIGRDSLYAVTVDGPDTLYVETVNQVQSRLGLKDSTFGYGSSFTNMSQGLIFDVLRPIVLDSLTVYPVHSGNVVVNITTATGDSVFVKTIYVDGAGPQKLAIGAQLPIGYAYRIRAMGSTTGGFFRNYSGIPLPMSDPDENVTIVRNVNNLYGYYYFWYDWVISRDLCSSERLPVILDILDKPNKPIVSNDTICQGDQVLLNIDSPRHDLAWYEIPQSSEPSHLGNNFRLASLDTTSVFFVQAIDTNGCKSDIADVEVLVNKSPEAPILEGDSICFGGRATLSAQSTDQVLWFDSDQVTFLDTGFAYVSPSMQAAKRYFAQSISDENCKSEMASAVVIVKARPETGFTVTSKRSKILVSSINVIPGYRHTWQIGDSISIGGPSDSAHFYSNGIVQIVHSVFDSTSGCSASDTASYTMLTASRSQHKIVQMSLFPNPNRGSFVVRVPKFDSDYALEIKSVEGQVVYSADKLKTEFIEVKASLAPGMYFVTLVGADSKHTLKIIVH